MIGCKSNRWRLSLKQVLFSRSSVFTIDKYFVWDQFQYCNSSMPTIQKEVADELRQLATILGCKHSQHLEISSSNRFKQELLGCKCTFNGAVERAILLLKLKINDFIQSHLHQTQHILSHQQQALHKALRKNVAVLNNSIEHLLHEGILTLYIEINEAKEECSSIKSSKVTQNLLRVIIGSMDSLLRYYFVFQEYIIRNNTKVKPKETSTYSLKTIPTLHSEGSSNHLDSQIDDQLINEIQNEINQKPLSLLFQEEMRKQRKKINESEELCRICFQSVKLNNLPRHVNNCAKKSNLKLQLETKNQQIRQLQEKLKQKYQQSCEESVHEEIDEEFRKICKLILHTSKNTERKGNKRCSLIGVKSQKNISERIQKYIESYLEDFEENQVLAQLLSNYRERSLIEKRINNIEISSLFSDQNENSSDLENPIQEKSIRRSNCKNHTALVALGQKSIFCQQAKKNKGSNVDIPYASSQDESQQLDKDQKITSKQRLDNSLKKLQTKRSLSKKNEKDLCDELECDFQVVKHYSSLHNIMDKPEEDDFNSSIRLKDFEILQFLGQGAFGKVYMARRKETKDIYALKIIKISEDYSDKELLAIKNQHEIFKKIAGDHLVKAPFSFSEKSCHIFVLEFLPGGDLRKLLTDEVYFEEDKAKFYIAEIILAIQHLHKYGIIHRDLKPQNLVIDRKGHLKLTDFGLSEFQVNKKLTQSRKEQEQAMQQAKSSRRRRRAAVYGVNKQKMQLIGTPDYIAPEIINQTSFSNYTIDWWSLGVMAYELIIGARPFCAQTIEEVIDNITNFNIEWPEVGEEQGMITAEAKDFISKLLNKDFSQRLGANGAGQIKLHPFLSGIDWVNLKTSSTLFLPRRLTKFSELVAKEQDKKLKRQIQLFMEEGKRGKNLHLQTFIRFDLLKSQTIENMQKKHQQTSKKLKRLKTLRQISNEIAITTEE